MIGSKHLVVYWGGLQMVEFCLASEFHWARSNSNEASPSTLFYIRKINANMFYYTNIESWYITEEKDLKLAMKMCFSRITRRGSPGNRRRSTDEASPIGKIHSSGKIAVILEPVMWFGCPSRFRISLKL